MNAGGLQGDTKNMDATAGLGYFMYPTTKKQYGEVTKCWTRDATFV